MNINLRNYNDVTVIELKDQFAKASADSFDDLIKRAVDSRKTGIVIDMTNVNFIDSAGLQKLIWARNFSNNSRSQLRLTGLNENCCDILRITRLDGNFDCYESLTDAIKSCA